MYWILALSILLSFGFGQFFKWSQRRGRDAPAVVTINYLVLATLLLVYYVATQKMVFADPVWLVGMLTGTSFIVSMLLMTWALEIANVAVVLTAFRLSIVVPVLAAICLWGQSVSWIQSVGITMALGGLVLMTTTPKRLDGRRRDLGLATLVFMTQGLSQVCIHWVHHAGLDAARLKVLMVTAATAGCLGAIVVLLRRRLPNRADLRMGAGIGVLNLAALATIFTALTYFDGAVFFPVTGCAIVILDNLFAHFFWHEKLGCLAIVGVVLGACSMLLIL